MSTVLSGSFTSKDSKHKQITQDELRSFHAMEQRFIRAKSEYYAEMGKLILRMNSGQRQEAGKYGLRKRTIMRRRISWKSVVIDLRGKNYVETKLADTKPTYSYRLEFADIGPRNVGV